MSLAPEVDLGRLRVSHMLDYESELFRDRYNSMATRRGPRVLHDLEITVQILDDRLEGALAIRNLTDRQTQDIDGFPVPGRSIFVELTLSGVAGHKVRRPDTQ